MVGEGIEKKHSAWDLLETSDLEEQITQDIVREGKGWRRGGKKTKLYGAERRS